MPQKLFPFVFLAPRVFNSSWRDYDLSENSLKAHNLLISVSKTYTRIFVY